MVVVPFEKVRFLLDIKEKIDLISKRADIINKKLIILLAINGAVWIYGIKSDGWLFNISVLIFCMISFAIITNTFKLGDLDKQLKDMLDDK